jgi:hypothetical protein
MVKNIQILCSPRERKDGNLVKKAPKTKEFFDCLKTKTSKELKELGVGVWDSNEKGTMYLYPKEWYNSIPEGYEVVGLFGNSHKFKHGVSDDDIRFGMLPYGFLVGEFPEED